MRHLKILGLCLMAVFVVAAVAATTASASLPEWGGCEPAPVGHGKYKDAACVVPATGAAKKTEGDYEWYTGNDFGWVTNRENGIHHGEPEVVLELGIAATTFETTGGHAIACSGGNGQFSLNLAESTKGMHEVYLDFEGCHEVGGEEKLCSSPGHFGGEITDLYNYELEQALRGSLGFVAGKGTEDPTVGLSLTTFNKDNPETHQPEILLTAVCEAGEHSIGTVWLGGNKKGGNTVISVIEPVDTMTKTYTQTYAAAAGEPGVQQWTGFEGKHNAILDEFLLHNFEQSAWNTSLTDHLGGRKDIEIKAER